MHNFKIHAIFKRLNSYKIIALFFLFFCCTPFKSWCYLPDNWVVHLDNPNWSIPFAFLKINDGGTSSILNVSTSAPNDYPFFGTTILPVINHDASTIDLPVLGEGLYVFYVTYLSDDNFPFYNAVFVVVTETDELNVGDCCPSDCNLVCHSDFEKYTINEPTGEYPCNGKIFINAQTAPFKFNNYHNLGPYLSSSNDAHISSDGNNKKLFLPDRFGYPKPVVLPKNPNPRDYTEYEQGFESGFIIKLREPINYRETVNINFDATIFGGNNESNESLENTFGHVRLFAMENDFSPLVTNNIEYPYTTINDPFTFNGSGDKGYYINSGLETDYFGIPINRESVDAHAPFSDIHQTDILIGVENLDNFQNINFNWTNLTTKSINAIMIVGDGYSPIITPEFNKPLERNLPEPVETGTFFYVVAVDNFEVKKSTQSIPLCITGDESEICLGNCTHIIEYEVCWCDEPNEKAQPFTFEVSVNDVFGDVDVILPSGSFNSAGIASVTLDEPGDCTTLTFEVNIDLSVGAGTIELPLNFGVSGDCEMCTDGAFVESFTPSTIDMVDCNFTCGCSELNNIGAKNTSTLWSSLTNTQKEKRCYAVEGTLVIDENVIFEEKTFIMNGDSKINISDNVVDFKTCDIKGCEYLWNGIELTSENSYLNIYGTTRISDAKTAVIRRRYNATLNVSGAIFHNNYVGISLAQDFLTSNATNIPARITGNTFSSSSLLKSTTLESEGKIGYAGITIYKANENIGSRGMTTSNTFKDIANGVISDESTLGITNNKFENITEKSYYKNGTFVSGHGILHRTNNAHKLFVGGSIDESFPNSTNIFKSVNRAVQGSGIMEVHNTVMEDVNYGIDLRARVGSQIWSTVNTMGIKKRGYILNADKSDASGKISANDIIFAASDNNSIGIAVNMQNFNSTNNDLTIDYNYIFGRFGFGMFINNLKDAEIRENYIGSYNTGFYGMRISGVEDIRVYDNTAVSLASGANSIGIYLSKFEDSYLNCNYTNNTATGIQFGNVNMNSDLKTNVMEDNSYAGLRFGKGATLVASGSGVHQNAANQWTGTFSGETAIHEGTEDQIRKSAFRTEYDILPYYPEDYVALNENPLNLTWFTANSGFDIPGDCDYPLGDPAGLTWMLDFASDSVDFAVYDEQLKSQAKNQVYSLMNKYPGLSYSLDLQDFYDDYALTDAGKINELRKDLEAAQVMPLLTSDAIDSLNIEINNVLSDILDLQEALPTNPTPMQLASYKSAVETLSNEINSLRVEIKDLLDEFEDDKEYAISLVVYGMAFISEPSDVPTRNAWVETVIEADYLYSGLPTITGSELTDLLSIAGQCPDYGGQAVYWSRALVNKEYPYLTWDDEAICQDTLGSPGFRDIPTKKVFGALISHPEFTSSPNPSNGIVNITASEDFLGRIIVKDIIGRELYTGTYMPGMTIDLAKYTGLLIINWITSKGDILSTTKQVILK